MTAIKQIPPVNRRGRVTFLAKQLRMGIRPDEVAEIIVVYAGVVGQELTVPQDTDQHPYDH